MKPINAKPMIELLLMRLSKIKTYSKNCSSDIKIKKSSFDKYVENLGFSCEQEWQMMC